MDSSVKKSKAIISFSLYIAAALFLPRVSPNRQAHQYKNSYKVEGGRFMAAASCFFRIHKCNQRYFLLYHGRIHEEKHAE